MMLKNLPEVYCVIAGIAWLGVVIYVLICFKRTKRRIYWRDSFYSLDELKGGS